MLDTEPVLEPGQELRLESLCIAGPAAAVAIVPPGRTGDRAGGD